MFQNEAIYFLFAFCSPGVPKYRAELRTTSSERCLTFLTKVLKYRHEDFIFFRRDLVKYVYTEAEEMESVVNFGEGQKQTKNMWLYNEKPIWGRCENLCCDLGNATGNTTRNWFIRRHVYRRQDAIALLEAVPPRVSVNEFIHSDFTKRYELQIEIELPQCELCANHACVKKCPEEYQAALEFFINHNTLVCSIVERVVSEHISVRPSNLVYSRAFKHFLPQAVAGGFDVSTALVGMKLDGERVVGIISNNSLVVPNESAQELGTHGRGYPMLFFQYICVFEKTDTNMYLIDVSARVTHDATGPVHEVIPPQTAAFCIAAWDHFGVFRNTAPRIHCNRFFRDLGSATNFCSTAGVPHDGFIYIGKTCIVKNKFTYTVDLKIDTLDVFFELVPQKPHHAKQYRNGKRTINIGEFGRKFSEYRGNIDSKIQSLLKTGDNVFIAEKITPFSATFPPPKAMAEWFRDGDSCLLKAFVILEMSVGVGGMHFEKVRAKPDANRWDDIEHILKTMKFCK